MAVNDDIADRAVAHRIRLEALANNNVRRVNAAVIRAQREILQLVGALSAEGAGPEQIVRAIRQALNRQTPLLRAAIEDELLNLSHYEADATIRMIETALPRNVALDFTTPAPSQLAAVLTNPLAGRTLEEWFSNLTTSFFDRARQAVRVGFLQGETTAKIASELREGFDIDRRNAETIVRTLVASLAQNARQLAFDDNADLFTGLMWRSTLDPRTCLAAGSQVETPQGTRPIESLRAGDTVTGGSGKPRTVIAASKRKSKRCVRVRLSDGRSIVCTDDHLFQTGSGEWKPASELVVGGKLAYKLKCAAR